jgi:hypothetical protein
MWPLGLLFLFSKCEMKGLLFQIWYSVSLEQRGCVLWISENCQKLTNLQNLLQNYTVHICQKNWKHSQVQQENLYQNCIFTSQVKDYDPLLSIFTSQGLRSAPHHLHKSRVTMCSSPSSQVKGYDPLLSIFTSQGLRSAPLHLHKSSVTIRSSASSQVKCYDPLLSIFTSQVLRSAPLHLHKSSVTIRSSASSQVKGYDPLLSIFTSQVLRSAPLHLHKSRVTIQSSRWRWANCNPWLVKMPVL